MRRFKLRGNRFCGAYNYGTNIIRAAWLADMTNRELRRHVIELSATGKTVVDGWEIRKCPLCGLAYVYDISIKNCHRCPKRYKNRKLSENTHLKDGKIDRKECAVCGRIFVDDTRTHLKKYCSSECRKLALKKQKMESIKRCEAKKGMIKVEKISEHTGNTRNQTDRKCG